ncbi:hypothetical protein FR943_02380 [Mycobacterium sp. TNTM28]|uniref:Uncharacterized protein n=1 Tax=[Mycobacterium] fortunisiensis TaxID=2600579 RepID=A0ABS6KGK9_9MYCO|nr:Rv0340 family IniB-related protein [[Mycobacterium] fortunisiensis]MBU9762700.1 hypothetical protein [[Mycobacterium] fortunisiensis]
MANSLLDFVMSLVRDPDAAARYAADPAQAIADAHLADVTSADVNNLIPVVSESLSMTGSNGGWGDLGASDDGGNVWASGAATAAFDAFDDHVPFDNPDDAWGATAGPVIDQSDSGQPASSIDAADLTQQPLDDLSSQLNQPAIEEVPILDPASDLDSGLDWAHPVTEDPQHPHDAGGFDIFD